MVEPGLGIEPNISELQVQRIAIYAYQAIAVFPAVKPIQFARLLMGCISVAWGQNRTDDLWLMRPTSYQLLYPAKSPLYASGQRF